jgi:hypothetical protein
MSRKAIYENPSQRRSSAEAFSTGRFVNVRKKILVWVERPGDLRVARIAMSTMIASGKDHEEGNRANRKMIIIPAIIKRIYCPNCGGVEVVRSGFRRK